VQIYVVTACAYILHNYSASSCTQAVWPGLDLIGVTVDIKSLLVVVY
jgi:hypothetical protein